jgi:hypothetical protein
MKKVFIILFLLIISFNSLGKSIEKNFLVTNKEHEINCKIVFPDKKGVFPSILIIHDSEIYDIDGNIDILESNFLSTVLDESKINILRRFLKKDSNLPIYKNVADELSKDFNVIRFEKRRNLDTDLIHEYTEDIIEIIKHIKKFESVNEKEIYILSHGQASYLIESVTKKIEICGIIYLTPYLLPHFEQIEYYMNYQIHYLNKILKKKKDIEESTKPILKKLEEITRLKNNKTVFNEEYLILGYNAKSHFDWHNFSQNISNFIFNSNINSLIIMGESDFISPSELIKKFNTEKSYIKVVEYKNMGHFLDNNLKLDGRISKEIKQWVINKN